MIWFTQVDLRRYYLPRSDSPTGFRFEDLKMQNVVVVGFDNETPGSGKGLLAKIADLGMRMSTSLG